jgi:hypothetical protein
MDISALIGKKRIDDQKENGSVRFVGWVKISENLKRGLQH